LSAQANLAIKDVGAEQYQAIDDLMDDLCANLPVLALCQYDAPSTSDASRSASLAAAVESHLDAVQDAEMRLRREADRMWVGGDVDLASAAVLGHALRRLCQSLSGSDMVLDLTGLTFVDVAGCRALVTGTETLRDRGGTVSLSGVRGHRLKVIRLLGMDRLPGVELV
jgi:anti-anti-sigma factor